jgi:hypothetical protein
MVNGQALASATFDQRSGGDQWHTLAVIQLSPSDQPYVRMSCPGSAPCIADALYLRSRGRYNDGSPVASLTLAPMDGAVLRRSLYWLYLPLLRR